MAKSMSDPITHCPWCSVLLPAPGAEKCPSCGAALTAVPDSPAEIKGVTTLDTEAILRARSEVSRPRGNRLLSFITGEIPVDTSTPAAAEVFAPPPEDVRREMLRLQMDAQRADLAAETVALKSDELARRGHPHLGAGGGRAGGPTRSRSRECTPARCAEPEPETEPEPEPRAGDGDGAGRPGLTGRRVSSGGDARTTPAPRPLVPARAGDPHRRPPPPGRDGQARGRSRRLVARRALGGRSRGDRELSRGRSGRRPATRPAAAPVGPDLRRIAVRD